MNFVPKAEETTRAVRCFVAQDASNEIHRSPRRVSSRR